MIVNNSHDMAIIIVNDYESLRRIITRDGTLYLYENKKGQSSMFGFPNDEVESPKENMYSDYRMMKISENIVRIMNYNYERK
jgi:hypothetical protein